MPTGANELSRANAISAITSGLGPCHQVLNLKRCRSSDLLLPAKAVADSPEMTPARTALVGPSATFNIATTAKLPMPHPGDQHRLPSLSGMEIEFNRRTD